MTDIFDFHTHTGIAHNTVHLPEEILSLFKGSNVKGVLCSSLSGIFDRKTAENDISALLAKDERIAGAYWLNPYLPGWQNYLDSFFGINKISFIKLSPTANIYEPDCDFLHPVFDYCSQTGKHIVIHTDEYRSNPLKYALLIRQYPKVNIVLCHLNASVINIQVAAEYENVFLETSFCEKIMGLASLKMAYKVLGSERLLFGTDYPVCCPYGTENFSYDIFLDIYASVLKPRDLEKIMCRNAENLFFY